MNKYIPSKIENKWQTKWRTDRIYNTNLTKNQDKKYYVLAEFAYPSGDLHVGHWFTFVGADIFARFKRMQGYNVFFPNGFDSFGLPAEGAAIKRGIHPQDWTESNIEKMKQQYSTTGGSFEFYGDLAAHRPIYYRWNQWIFLRLFEKGLAYRGTYLANWCPFDQTVLANEAIEGGKCWRCGSEVVQKEVEQWFFKITDFADRLIWPEKPSVDWPISVRDAQNSWIGKSEGLNVKLGDIEVFTTRADTIFGVSFVVLSPEHPLLEQFIQNDRREEVEAYLAQAKKKTELERKENKDKTGVFTGSFVKNPLSGQDVPVWVADYVLPGYGTGAVMGVPAHDQRDFDFAHKFNLQVKQVISKSGKEENLDKPYVEEGVLINSDKYSGLSSAEAQKAISEFVTKNNLGRLEIIYHLHDWSISRQRYWGTPIPIVHCTNCGIVPVPEQDLPVELPYEVDYTPKGKSPLESNEAWINVQCPKCGKDAKRDPDTMDTFVDSSWYFFRYLDPTDQEQIFKPDLAAKIMPVDIYFGGAEHTLGHTLYSRFITKFFHDLGLTELEEYAKKRVNHGIVLGPDGQKMSKSRGNVVNPDDEVKKYGADAVRAHVAFFIPYDGVGPWISERIWGPYRFLERAWDLFDKVAETDVSKQDQLMLNKTVKRVTEDIENIKFNTAIAALMEWINYLSKREKISLEEYKTFLKLLAPFAPHMSEELWEKLKGEYSVHQQLWPTFDESKLASELVTIVVQINGKVRDQLQISREESSEANVINIAKNSQKIQKFLENKPIIKTVYVANKIINIVI